VVADAILRLDLGEVEGAARSDQLDPWPATRVVSRTPRASERSAVGGVVQGTAAVWASTYVDEAAIHRERCYHASGPET
jgi:hypothetical protein